MLLGKLLKATEPTERPGACQVARQYAVTALELDPRSDLAQHLMGRWHWEMAQLNSVVRFLVKSCCLPFWMHARVRRVGCRG